MKRIGFLLVVLLLVVMLPLPGEGSAAGPVTVQSSGVSYANFGLAYNAASDDDILQTQGRFLCQHCFFLVNVTGGR